MEKELYYKILHVNRDSSMRKITHSYRKLAIKYHPYVKKDTKYYDRFVSIHLAFSLLSKFNERQTGRYRTREELFNEWNEKIREQVIREAGEYAVLPTDIFEKKLLKGFSSMTFVIYGITLILSSILLYIPFTAYLDGKLSLFWIIVITGTYTFPLFAYSIKIFNKQEQLFRRFRLFNKRKSA
ncbi:MAG: DnaJ domain-containing protein [Salinivirgaceae bacterium]|nr:DnaJ domain-containing protein [Salinivirgaceae bacterium]